jgi:hypothetical protein
MENRLTTTELLPVRGAWVGGYFELELVKYRRGIRHDVLLTLKPAQDGTEWYIIRYRETDSERSG